MLDKLIDKLEGRLEKEVDKSTEDMAWALEKNEKAADKANEVMSRSVYKNLGIGFGVVAGLVLAVSYLPSTVFYGVGYLLIGYKVVDYSDYHLNSVKGLVALCFWLPLTLLGVGKKVVEGVVK